MAKKLAIFTNNSGLVSFFQSRSEYDLVASLDKKDQILSKFEELDSQGNLPELVLVTRGVDETNPTPTKDILIQLKNRYKDRIRIVYIVGEVEPDQKTVSDIKELISVGIYDLVTSSSMTGDMICSRLENPITYEEASKILNIPEYENETYSNVILISSLKPGTGKTFLATNLAIAIAKYGQDKRMPDGSLRRPRIAIVDGDLLNLGVGTTLRTDNYDRNMLTALKKIGDNVKDDGSYNLNDAQLNDLKNFVRSCLVRYKNVDNLYCMVAPEIPLKDLPKIAPVHFYFMLQMLTGAFDIIIVDSNSSFDHQTTGPLYEMSGTIYLLIDNDYNNIQNNLRYFKQIERLGYKNKVHFVINKDLTNELERLCLEDLAYNTQTLGDLLIEHRIPLVPYGIVKGLEYAEKILVTEDDPEILDARNAILEFANDIWKIENSMIVKDVEAKQEAEKPAKKGSLLDKLNK